MGSKNSKSSKTSQQQQSATASSSGSVDAASPPAQSVQSGATNSASSASSVPASASETSSSSCDSSATNAATNAVPMDPRTRAFADRLLALAGSHEKEAKSQYSASDILTTRTPQERAMEVIAIVSEVCIEGESGELNEEKILHKCHFSTHQHSLSINIQLGALYEKTKEDSVTFLQLILDSIQSALQTHSDHLDPPQKARGTVVTRILRAIVNTITQTKECDAHYINRYSGSIVHRIVTIESMNEPAVASEIQSLLCQLVKLLLSQANALYRPPLDAFNFDRHTALTSLLVKSSAQWLHDQCRMVKLLRKHKAPFDASLLFTEFSVARPGMIELLLHWHSSEEDLTILPVHTEINFDLRYTKVQRSPLVHASERAKEHMNDECALMYFEILQQLSQARKRIREQNSLLPPFLGTDPALTEYITDQLSILPTRLASSRFIARFTSIHNALSTEDAQEEETPYTKRMRSMGKMPPIDTKAADERRRELNNQLRGVVHDLMKAISEEAAGGSASSCSSSASSSSSSPKTTSPSYRLNISATQEGITLLHCLFALPTDLLSLFGSDAASLSWLLTSIRNSSHVRTTLLAARQDTWSSYHTALERMQPFRVLFLMHRPQVKGDFIWCLYKEMIQLAFGSCTKVSASSLQPAPSISNSSSSSSSGPSGPHLPQSSPRENTLPNYQAYPYQDTIIAPKTLHDKGCLAADLSEIMMQLAQTHLPESILGVNKRKKECTREQARLVLELLYDPDDIEGLNAFRFPASGVSPASSRAAARKKHVDGATDFFSLFFSRCEVSDVKVWLSLTRDTHDCLWPSRVSHAVYQRPIIRVVPPLYDIVFTPGTLERQERRENKKAEEILKLLDVERIRWEGELIPQMRNELSVWLISDLAQLTLQFLIPDPKRPNFLLVKEAAATARGQSDAIDDEEEEDNLDPTLLVSPMFV